MAEHNLAKAGKTCRPFCAEQEALQHDPDALSALRLSRMNGAQLQKMLSRPGPLPAQEQRAALLREACLIAPLPAHFVES